jgi:hypothetical protein
VVDGVSLTGRRVRFETGLARCDTLYYIKTEVCCWRLSRELKAELEAEARRRKVSFSALVENLAREGLVGRKAAGEEAAQARLQVAAGKWIGVLPARPGGMP